MIFFISLQPFLHWEWRIHHHTKWNVSGCHPSSRCDVFIRVYQVDHPTSSYILHPEHGAALRGPIYDELTRFLSPCVLGREGVIADHGHPVFQYLPDDAYRVYTKPRNKDPHTQYVDSSYLNIRSSARYLAISTAIKDEVTDPKMCRGFIKRHIKCV